MEGAKWRGQHLRLVTLAGFPTSPARVCSGVTGRAAELKLEGDIFRRRLRRASDHSASRLFV